MQNHPFGDGVGSLNVQCSEVCKCLKSDEFDPLGGIDPSVMQNFKHSS